MGTGIAIDQTGIRIIQARHHSGNVTIDGAGYFPFNEPYENWQTGFVEYQKSYTLPSGSAFVGVSGKHLSLRHVTLPARNDAELDKLVKKEVEQFAGSHQQEDLTHAYQDVTPSGSAPNEVTILLGILRSEWILQADELLKRHDLNLDACIPDAISIYEPYRHSPHAEPASDQITMLAWVGYSSIDVCLVKNGQLIAARNTSGGISTILDAMNSEEDTRELYKQFVGRGESRLLPEKDLDEDVQSLLDRSMSRLSLRLSTAYDYFQDEFPNLPEQPERVFMSGQAARIPSLTDKLGSTLDLPIQVFDPSELFDVSGLPKHKHSTFRTVGPEWTTALGLALANDRNEDTLLSFKTPAAKRKESWWKMEVPAMIGFSVLFLAFLVYGIQSYRANSGLSQAREKLNSQLADLRQRQKTYRKHSREAKSRRKQLTHLRVLRNHGLAVLKAIRRIPGLQPEEAILSGLRLHPDGKIQLDGYVSEYVTKPLSIVKTFQNRIRNNTPFDVERIPQDTDGDQKRFRFHLTSQTEHDLAKTQ